MLKTEERRYLVSSVITVLTIVAVAILYTGEPKKEGNVEVKKYSNPEMGISFEHPARFTEFPLSDNFPSSMYAGLEYGGSGLGSAPEQLILVSVHDVPIGKTFESVILENTSFDGSGLSPSSLSEFSTEIRNGRTVYYIRTGRFEAMLSFAFYVIQGGKVYRFMSVTQGVADWVDDDLDESKDPTRNAVEYILDTLQLS